MAGQGLSHGRIAMIQQELSIINDLGSVLEQSKIKVPAYTASAASSLLGMR